MKQSRILKILSYIALPILIGAIIISFIQIGIQNSTYYNKEKYFSSEMFVNSYTGVLSIAANKLIYNNDQYKSVKDNEAEIFYINEEIRAGDNISELYYLIIYKNKAITNVDMLPETNTIEKIRQYIDKNEQSKKVTIIDGKIEADAYIIENKAMKYLNVLEYKYYTREPSENFETDEEQYNSVQYITATLNDFEIYSSYMEEFPENSEQVLMCNIMEKLSKFESFEYVIIPACSILSILIIIYLIISIGYQKGSEQVVLNDFDKIPFEIIVFVAIMLGCILIIPFTAVDINKVELLISVVITSYLVIYVLSAITIHTLIKRIKSKTFFRTTLTGKILIFIRKCCVDIGKDLKKAKQTIARSTSTATKVLLHCSKYVIIALTILLFSRISFLTFVLETILVIILIYKIVKTTTEFDMIENKLKEMYEGNNENKLKAENFTPGFRDTVTYINDISNGFENAIQDRIKSERLKAELITNVSHDIKTPLTSIINYVDLLKQEDVKDEKAKEYIGILDNKSQRLKKLTEDLVEASKVSTGNISLNLEKINVVELIKQATGEFEDKFKKKGLETIIDSKENEINIMADSRYMYRIVDNLFSNISKYALEKSRVYVDIKMGKNGTGTQIAQNVIIEIKNISKNKLNITAEELMQRFVRGDKSRTTEGSGLGISIAQNLTELQNGKFELKLDGDLFKVELEFECI